MNVGEEKSLNNFDNIESRELRTWNRCATFFNLIADSGRQAGLSYLKGFDANSKKDISIMFALINSEGISEVKRKVVGGEPVIGGC